MLALAVRAPLSPSFTLDVDLQIRPGITILFGASGSGKTTVLRAVAGFVTPAAGRIAIDDRLLFDRTAGVNVPVPKRHVGYVFQDLALFPHMTVAANIAFGIAHLDAATQRERIDAIAGSFRIAHLLERRPSAISGGEQQRVALARALVTDPGVMLLDEPLAALDHATQSRIMADLRAWNAARNIPVLYVTHAHREVFALGERVVVLQGGRVVADGIPQQVLDAPVHEPLAQMAGFENLLDATVTARRPEAGTIECRLTGTTTDLEAPLVAAEPGARVRIAIRAGDIMLAIEEPRGLSARNVLHGTIASLRQELTTVIAEVDAGARFEVHLTPRARDTLSLSAGREIWLVIKTHSCRLVMS